MTYEIIRSGTPVARKKYRCDQCGTPIDPGCRYVHRVGKWEGEFDTYRAHEDCESAAQEIWSLANLDWDEGVIITEEYANEPEGTAAILVKDYPAVAARLGIETTAL